MSLKGVLTLFLKVCFVCVCVFQGVRGSVSSDPSAPTKVYIFPGKKWNIQRKKKPKLSYTHFTTHPTINTLQIYVFVCVSSSSIQPLQLNLWRRSQKWRTQRKTMKKHFQTEENMFGFGALKGNYSHVLLNLNVLIETLLICETFVCFWLSVPSVRKWQFLDRSDISADDMFQYILGPIPKVYQNMLHILYNSFAPLSHGTQMTSELFWLFI